MNRMIYNNHRHQSCHQVVNIIDFTVSNNITISCAYWKQIKDKSVCKGLHNLLGRCLEPRRISCSRLRSQHFEKPCWCFEKTLEKKPQGLITDSKKADLVSPSQIKDEKS